MSYQTLLRKLAPDLNPAGVEASMRLHYGTLNHLPRETFVEEARLPVHLADEISVVGQGARVKPLQSRRMGPHVLRRPS